MYANNREVRDNIINICQVLAEQEHLQATIIESGKGALIAGLGVFIGGILGGPIGMAVGGSVTSIAVAWSAKGNFKSVVEIISEMNDSQKRRLEQAVRKALENVKPETCISLLTLVLTTSSYKEVVLTELGAFLKRELQMQMIR